MKYTSKVIDKQKRLTLIYAENLIFREFDTFFYFVYKLHQNV